MRHRRRQGCPTAARDRILSAPGLTAPLAGVWAGAAGRVRCKGQRDRLPRCDAAQRSRADMGRGTADGRCALDMPARSVSCTHLICPYRRICPQRVVHPPDIPVSCDMPVACRAPTCRLPRSWGRRWGTRGTMLGCSVRADRA